MTHSNLTVLPAPKNSDCTIHRLHYCGMHVDFVTTSEGMIRIGSMPDIAKFMAEHDLQADIIVVPHWKTSQAGDNRTGEEFILWHAQAQNERPKIYVGQEQNITQLYEHLDKIFPYFFDAQGISIIKTDWLDKWFRPAMASPDTTIGKVSICCDADNILIKENGTIIYDQKDMPAASAPDTMINELLMATARDQTPRKRLEITPIGCGNGFWGTASNALVRFGETAIWIDPCGYPAHALARYNIHWDDITHVLFTHNHEDHVQGFTACMERVRITGRKLNIVCTARTYELLRELYSPLFSDINNHVTLHELTPGVATQLNEIQIESRWNHHILPYGTLGLKLSAKGKMFGYSGDTKFDEKLNDKLQRKELNADWFASCDLVFHEIEFTNPQSVHSYWEEVTKLQKAIRGEVLGYHAPLLHDSPFPLAKEGHRYIL